MNVRHVLKRLKLVQISASTGMMTIKGDPEDLKQILLLLGLPTKGCLECGAPLTEEDCQQSVCPHCGVA